MLVKRLPWYITPTTTGGNPLLLGGQGSGTLQSMCVPRQILQKRYSNLLLQALPSYFLWVLQFTLGPTVNDSSTCEAKLLGQTLGGITYANTAGHITPLLTEADRGNVSDSPLCSPTCFVTKDELGPPGPHISTTQALGYLTCATRTSLYGIGNLTLGFTDTRQALFQPSYISSILPLAPNLLLCFSGFQFIKRSTLYNRVFKLSISRGCFGFYTIETHWRLSAFYCHVTSPGNV